MVVVNTLEELIRHLGEFGIYQKRLLILVTLPSSLCVMLTLSIVFFVAEPKHRCQVQENDTFSSLEGWTKAEYNGSITRPLHVDSCHIYIDGNTSLLPAENDSRTIECDKWVYDQTDFDNTVTTEFDLVCSKTIYQSHSSMVFLLGCMAGSFLGGILSDSLGRRIAFCLAITAASGSSLGLIWIPNYVAFVALRFISGTGVMSTWNVAFIMGLELVGPSKRTLIGFIMEAVCCGAALLLAAMNYWLKNWRHIQIFLAITYSLFLPYWIVIPESPRWLLSAGKEKKAKTAISQIAKVNNVEVPNFQNLKENTNDVPMLRALMSIVKNKTLFVRMIVVTICWFVNNMGFYGITFNAGRIGGNIYVNYTASILMEFGGYLLCFVLTDKIGRKSTYGVSMLIGGGACIATIFTVLYASKDLEWITIVLSMIGKLGVSSAYGVMNIYIPELFPTNLRGVVLGFSGTLGKLGSTISPYIADLELLVDSYFGKSLPLLVFGVTMLTTSALVLLLPETTDRELPQTYNDAINLRKCKG